MYELTVSSGSGGTRLRYGDADPLVETAVDFLDREGALELGESPWPTYEDSDELYPTNWDDLFPETTPPDIFEEPTDRPSPFDDPWSSNLEQSDDLMGRIRDAAERRGIGQPEKGHLEHPGWDVCAWYQPIHFFGHNWGIFVREHCVFMHALRILPYVKFQGPLSYPQLLFVYKSLLRASFLTLYLHEHFHHKTESLGLRLHVADRKSAYVPYYKSVYRPNLGKDTLLEEALANADAYLRLSNRPYSNWIWKPILKGTKDYLAATYPHDPPGYRQAVRYLRKHDFNDGENLLQGQMRDASLTPSTPAADWNLAPRMTQSIFNIKSNIRTVVRAGARPRIPVTAPPRTCSTDEMVKLLTNHGYQVVPGGKGSHVKLKKPGAPMVILPGNRKDLSPGVVRNALRGLGHYAINDLTQLLILHA